LIDNRTSGKNMLIYKRLIIFIILFLTSLICFAQINVYDGFEEAHLSNIWKITRMNPNSLEIQSNIVRKGKSALKITLKTGDMAEDTSGKNKPTERDELLEIPSLQSIEGIKYEYRFSMFLPDSFPVSTTRLVIAQWKEDCPKSNPLCTDDSPVIALRYISGKLLITLTTDSGRRILYKDTNEIRNRWLDFKFQIKFSQRSDGEISAFINEKTVINYRGVTSYSEKHGYLKKNIYYFKMGLYRDKIPEPMTIYIDEYLKKTIKSE
jgi:hypothetical protein